MDNIRAARVGDKQKEQSSLGLVERVAVGFVLLVFSEVPWTEALQTPFLHSDSICSSGATLWQFGFPVHVYSTRTETLL